MSLPGNSAFETGTKKTLAFSSFSCLLAPPTFLPWFKSHLSRTWGVLQDQLALLLLDCGQPNWPRLYKLILRETNVSLKISDGNRVVQTCPTQPSTRTPTQPQLNFPISQFGQSWGSSWGLMFERPKFHNYSDLNSHLNSTSTLPKIE